MPALLLFACGLATSAVASPRPMDPLKPSVPLEGPPTAAAPPTSLSLGAPPAAGAETGSATNPDARQASDAAPRPAVDQARAALPGPGGDPRGSFDAGFDGAFVRTLDGEISFPEVELVRRNHAVGLYEGQRLRLKPWIPVSARASLGVDARGRLFHVLDLGDRTVGYLLSGDKDVRAAFLTERGALVAVDRAGRLYQYSPALWAKSGLARLSAVSLLRYAAAAAVLAGGLAAYGWFAGALWPPAPEALAGLGLGLVGAAMLEGFRAGVRYEAQNALTDGLRPLSARVDGYRAFEAEGRSARLLGERGGLSLDRLLERSGFKPGETENFDVQEKHARLPRGISPKVWEP